jgi:hypothetical protein
MAGMNDPNLNPNPNTNAAVWSVLAVCAALAIAGLIYSGSSDNQTALLLKPRKAHRPSAQVRVVRPAWLPGLRKRRRDRTRKVVSEHVPFQWDGSFIRWAHVLFGKPVPTPHQVRGRLFPGHALVLLRQKSRSACCRALSFWERATRTAQQKEWVRGYSPSISCNPSPIRMYCTATVALSQKERAQ